MNEPEPLTYQNVTIQEYGNSVVVTPKLAASMYIQDLPEEVQRILSGEAEEEELWNS